MLDLQHYRFDADIMQQLRKLIGEPMPGFMEPGTSYFSEAPSVRRKTPLKKWAASR